MHPCAFQKLFLSYVFYLAGSNHWYYFFNPLNKEKSEGTPDTVDWDFAQKEIAQSKGFQTGLGSGLSKGKHLSG